MYENGSYCFFCSEKWKQVNTQMNEEVESEVKKRVERERVKKKRRGDVLVTMSCIDI